MGAKPNESRALNGKAGAVFRVGMLLLCAALVGVSGVRAQVAEEAPVSAPRPTVTKPPAAIPKAQPVPAEEPHAETLPRPALSDNDTARWLAGLPQEGGGLRKFAVVPAWTDHAAELDAAWAQSERDRLSKVRAWAPTALGEVCAGDSPVFYFFSGPDFLYPHALFPNAKTYVLCAREPVGSQPDPPRIAPEELPGALARFRNAFSSLLGFSFVITKDLREAVEQPHIPGILPMLEVILARDGARVLEVRHVRCGADGLVSPEGNAKGGSPGVRIRFQMPEQPEQTLYYFFGDISNGGLEAHGGILRFCESLGRGRSLLKAASYLPHESEFTRINAWLMEHSSAIVQDPSGIPYRLFTKDNWLVRFWGQTAEPIEIFAKYADPDLQAAVTSATWPPLPFGFGYQYLPRKALLILAERRGGE